MQSIVDVSWQVGSRIGLWPCAVQYNPHQRFQYDESTERICLRKDSTFCVSTEGDARNGQTVSLQKDTDTSRQEKKVFVNQKVNSFVHMNIFVQMVKDLLLLVFLSE